MQDHSTLTGIELQTEYACRYINDICDVILQAGPSGHAALLHVDLSLPFQVHGEPPAEQLPLLRLQDGSVQVRSERQRSDPGRQPSLHTSSLPCWLMMRCC